MAENIIWIGLFFGICNTLILHLAKAMERQGIEIFSRQKSFKEKGKKPLIYLIGWTLNNTVFLFQVIAVQFSTATVFSSVFGLGLILLMFYSHYILHEDIKKPEIIGAIFIIFGTTLVGFFQIVEPSAVQVVNFTNFYILILILLIFFVVLFIFSLKTGIAIAIIFGLISGSLGAIDLVFKRIGLMEGLGNIWDLETLPLLLLSFLVGFLAFFMTQYGFAKGANASKLVPMFNSFYIIIPILFELVMLEGYILSGYKILALVIIVIGIFLMNIFKDPKYLIIEKMET